GEMARGPLLPMHTKSPMRAFTSMPAWPRSTCREWPLNGMRTSSSWGPCEGLRLWGFSMHAMVLRARGGPLFFEERPDPVPGAGEIRIRVEACAVCRTDLHVIDGELPHVHYPVVPGHEIVGIVDALGRGTIAWEIGQRVGIPWL